MDGTRKPGSMTRQFPSSGFTKRRDEIGQEGTRLSSATHESHLPPYWGTLYEITWLTPNGQEAKERSPEADSRIKLSGIAIDPTLTLALTTPPMYSASHRCTTPTD